MLLKIAKVELAKDWLLLLRPIQVMMLRIDVKSFKVVVVVRW